MVTRSAANFFILFCKVSQVLQGTFIKSNVTNSSFDLVKYDDLTKTVYSLSRYTPVGTKLTKVVLFQAVLCDIFWKKYFCSVRVDYLSSSKAEVSKFATFLWH